MDTLGNEFVCEDLLRLESLFKKLQTDEMGLVTSDWTYLVLGQKNIEGESGVWVKGGELDVDQK